MHPRPKFLAGDYTTTSYMERSIRKTGAGPLTRIGQFLELDIELEMQEIHC